MRPARVGTTAVPTVPANVPMGRDSAPPVLTGVTTGGATGVASVGVTGDPTPGESPVRATIGVADPGMTGAMASAIMAVMIGEMTGGMGREASNAAPEPLVRAPVREPVHRGVGAAKRAGTPARPGVEGASRRSGVAARG